MTTTQDDALERAGNHVLRIVNDGMLSLMLSVGHRTGLFDVMAGGRPATSDEIAAAAGLDERYVREWLGAMACGRVVGYDPAEGTYRLPAEYAAFLARAAGPDNLALQAQYVGLLGTVEKRVVDSFRHGGGVPYSAFAEFQPLMAEESAQVADALLLDTRLPLVPGLTARLAAGIDVADVGCGSGHLLNLMAVAYPASRFTGYDIADDALASGRAEAERMGLRNVEFVHQDGATLRGPARFDFVTTFDAVHDQAPPDLLLSGIAAALRDDGTYLCVDIAASSRLEDNLGNPFAPYIYTFSTMHCMTVSLAVGGMGLGTAWGKQLALSMLGAAGFRDVEVRTVDRDPLNNYYIARKPSREPPHSFGP